MIKEKIGGVPVTAPLWRGAPALTLSAIVGLLSSASYHYADDSGMEWSTANMKKMEAAALINQHKLDFSAIECLYKEAPQLFTLGDLINAVIKDLRK